MKTIASFMAIALFIGVLEVEAASRVKEVEAKIRADITAFILRLYPEAKFTTDIKVFPRKAESKAASKEQDLPFFDFAEIEAVDPWENPDANLFTLYSRIDRVQIILNFQDDINISNREYLVLNMLKEINLIPGRDTVELNFMDGPVFEKKWGSAFKNEYYLLTFFMAMAVLICGLLIVGVLNKKLDLNPLIQRNKKEEEKSAAPAVAVGGGLGGQTNIISKGTVNQQKDNSGSISLNDPTKSLEMAREKINEIVRTGIFPTLGDMLNLEKLLDKEPRAFAQLVYEFPLKEQDLIFAYGQGEKWYQGFNEIGALSTSMLMALDKMLRNRHYKSTETYEQLLIEAWRLGDKSHEFFSSIDREHAVNILYHLPKNIAIPIARKALPGGWGQILTSKKVVPIADEKIIKTLMDKALKIAPLLEKSALEVYTNRRDLLEYLQVCEVNEEQEIYMISDQKESLMKVRPPFYLIFEAEDKVIRALYDKFAIDEWALMLFNTPRDLRRKFESVLTEKERYLISIYMGQLDKMGLNYKQRGELRQKAAALLIETIELSQAPVVNEEEHDEPKQVA